MKINKQKGFTLVEIAIVLVIIGLLLGGILKGQELINSARVRNLADQSSASQAAYYGFIDRYRQVPGDWIGGAGVGASVGLGQLVNSPVAGEAACNIGNGRIDLNCYQEASGLWEQLSKAGFISGLYVGGGTAANFTDGTRAPVNAFNGTVALSRFTGAAADYQGAGGTRLSYLFGNQIPVSIMRELDVKLDDGIPNTGVLRAMTDGAAGTTNMVPVSGQPAGAAACVAANVWDITTDSQDCNGVLLF